VTQGVRSGVTDCTRCDDIHANPLVDSDSRARGIHLSVIEAVALSRTIVQHARRDGYRWPCSPSPEPPARSPSERGVRRIRNSRCDRIVPSRGPFSGSSGVTSDRDYHARVSKVAQIVARVLPPKLFHALLNAEYRLAEPELRRVAEITPRDRVAVDVGAWRGPWTLRLASFVPVVHAFEANPRLAALLSATAPPNVEVHAVAVSDQSGEATFWVADPNGLGAEGTSSLERAVVNDRTPTPQVVPVVALDDLDLGDVGFLKIDVEGHERSVLQGATGLLRKFSPVVLIEVEQRHLDFPISEVWTILEELGYVGWFLQKRRWVPLDRFDLQRDQLAVVGRIESSGFLRNSLINSRKYVNNFVFTPASQPPLDLLGRTRGATGTKYGVANLLLQARQAGHRLLRGAKYLLGHDPIFLPILLRLTPSGISRQITEHTDLVVEGFPRSGNTFTVFALQDASNHQLRITKHVHQPSQIKLGLYRGVPTVLVVREPVAVLSSYLVYAPQGRPAGVIKEYISYHRELVPYAEQLLVCDFEEITSDMSAVIARINYRYSMNIPSFDQSAANVERLFTQIAREFTLLNPRRRPSEIVAAPSSDRREMSARAREELLNPRNKTLLNEAFEVYEYLANISSEQRARRVPSSDDATPVARSASAD
jgi:FkbM family methyltransferase